MYKILKNFKDKYTGERYKAGQTKHFTDERAREILLVDKLIELIDKPKNISNFKKENVEKIKNKK